MLHVIIGTKGQLIKTLPILKELEKRQIPYNLINAAQHAVILEKISQQFNLKKADYTLYHPKTDISNIFQITFWFFKNILKTVFHKKEIFKGKKGYCLLHGDAPPALLGLIMCKIAGIKIIQVEAGERSHDIFNPFPEELIRRTMARFSDIMFTDFPVNYKNLIKEKVKGKIYPIGFNTILDTVRIALEKCKKTNKKEPYVLTSMHRFENIVSKQRLTFITDTVKKIAQDYKIIFILHEPTKRQLIKFNLLSKLKTNKNIILLPLQDYFSFINLINDSIFIITDGCGPQQEANILNKPCLLLRKTSERLFSNDFRAGFDLNKVDYFLKSYNQFQSNVNLKESPSKKIVDVLEQLPEVKKFF